MPTTLLALVLLVQQPAEAKPDPTTQIGGPKATHAAVEGFVLRSAEKMPVEHFSFQPTPEVRSFGQILAHVADANHLLCSPALGEPNPNGEALQKTENDKLGREALLARLKESFAYCGRASSALTDATPPISCRS